MRHWAVWLDVVSPGGSDTVAEITDLDSKQRGQMCHPHRRQVGREGRRGVDSCGGRKYWQIPWPQDSVGDLGRPHLKCSLGTGLLDDTILAPVSGTDLCENPNLLILLCTCSSSFPFPDLLTGISIFLACSYLSGLPICKFFFLKGGTIDTF